jgi:hypothetical protein
MGVSDERHAPAALYDRERALGTHWIGGWVNLRVGLDKEARGFVQKVIHKWNIISH